MKIGTKSVLYGAHCFFIHPWFVALAWWRLYGFPWDPRLWVAFFVHDLGYWGLPNMDGPEGEDHVWPGARLMHRLFDLSPGHPHYEVAEFYSLATEWGDLCLYHSRYFAKERNQPPSRLCYADKLAFVLTPSWLYVPMVWLTGEWREYAAAHDHECHGDGHGLLHWYFTSRAYTSAWVKEHANTSKEDLWTKTKPKPKTVETADSQSPPHPPQRQRPIHPPTSPGYQPPDV